MTWGAVYKFLALATRLPLGKMPSPLRQNQASVSCYTAGSLFYLHKTKLASDLCRELEVKFAQIRAQCKGFGALVSGPRGI